MSLPKNCENSSIHYDYESDSASVDGLFDFKTQRSESAKSVVNFASGRDSDNNRVDFKKSSNQQQNLSTINEDEVDGEVTQSQRTIGRALTESETEPQSKSSTDEDSANSHTIDNLRKKESSGKTSGAALTPLYSNKNVPFKFSNLKIAKGGKRIYKTLPKMQMNLSSKEFKASLVGADEFGYLYVHPTDAVISVSTLR
jgi:hypothetical protein